MTDTTVTEVNDPAARAEACEEVLRSLPDWFGIESAVQAYVDDVRELPTWVVADPAGQALGLLAVKQHTAYAAEIYVMGVRPEAHGRGIGTALVEAAEAMLRARSVEFLQVKTLGPSRPSQHYEGTRRFYESRGFRPLEELHGLWEGNPALIMVKRLEPSPPAGRPTAPGRGP